LTPLRNVDDGDCNGIHLKGETSNRWIHHYRVSWTYIYISWVNKKVIMNT
jgi:hypothetical protein